MASNIESILGAYRPFFDAEESTNFRHITRNLVCMASLYDRVGQHEKRDRIIGICARYILLLDEFPDLKERDLHTLTPGCYGAEQYVQEQWRRLKGAVPDSVERATLRSEHRAR
jgi:hypothetical protein